MFYMGNLQQGDRIIASNSLYGRTTQLLNQELTRFGVQTTTVDSRDLQQVRGALEKPAKVLFVETMHCSREAGWLTGGGRLVSIGRHHRPD